MWRDIRNFFLAILCAILFFSCVPYMLEARARIHASDWRTEASPDGRYLAKYTYIAYDQALLRVYSSTNGHLLAERTFIDALPVDLKWGTGKLVYATTDDSFLDLYTGTIKLPPTLFDQIVAQFP